MSNAKLVDLSHWNGPSDQKIPVASNWALASEKGVVGAILRLGSINNVTGECYLDYRLFEHLDHAEKAGKPVGYYFYSRPKFDGKKQADFILETIRKYQLPVTLDIWYDVEELGLNPTQAAQSTKAACEVIASEYPRRTDIYTRQSFWDTNVAADPLWSSLGLAAARYANLTSPWSDGKYIFRDWKDWKYWQYSATNNGEAYAHGWTNGSISLDLDYYNGDEAAFRKAYGLNPLDDVYAKLEELTRLVAGLQVGHDALTAADEQLKNRLTALEVEQAHIKTAASIQAEATRILSGKLDAQTAELVRLVNWAKNINLK